MTAETTKTETKEAKPMHRMTYEIEEIENGYLFTYLPWTSDAHGHRKEFAASIGELNNIITAEIERAERERDNFGTTPDD